MRTMTNLVGAVAAIAVMAGAGSAAAATIFTPINQSALDSFGSSIFGATITTTGLFSHTFNFTTTGKNNASASVVTIELQSGLKDIDFTSVKLDGVAFSQVGSDPFPETWQMPTATLLSGAHTLYLAGKVVTAGAGLKAASYSGTLNLSPIAVPEPTTWALMLLGFGGAGATLRSRRRAALAA